MKKNINPSLSVLVIEDDIILLNLLKKMITSIKNVDCNVLICKNGSEGYEALKAQSIDLVITDFNMPGWSGLTVLEKTKELNPDIDVVIMTAHADIHNAVKIMKNGAYDYLLKPIEQDELEILITRLWEKQTLVRENRLLKSQLQDKFKFDTIIYQSSEMEEVLNTAARAAKSNATILIRGESGTGKEMIAQAIHYSSERKNDSFVIVNMAALPENLIESELFGHKRGAFTGATQDRKGRFEKANGGTLFIDELGDIPLSIQVKLLRAIQFGEIEPLGSNTIIKVDVRIIAATNRNLEEMIKQNQFREDFYYRLNTLTLWIPPLRKRKTDVKILVDFFINKYTRRNNKPIEGISHEVLDQLMRYNYPGNIRELENIIERAVVLCRGKYITRQDLPPQIEATTLEEAVFDPCNLEHSYEEKMRHFELAMIKEALSNTSGNQSAAAKILGISERRIRFRMEKLGIKRKRTLTK